MLFQIFLALILGLANPASSTSNCNGTDPGVSVNDDTSGPGGDQGQIPPPKP